MSDENTRLLMEMLGNVTISFWVCPVRDHRDRENTVTVRWEGDVAHCTVDGCGLTSDTRMIKNTDHPVRHPWPADCELIQGGKSGLVLSRTGNHYTTAFVEAFPRSPATFIRGEGADLIEAEDAAWAKWQKTQACPSAPDHEFETRGYDNGAGFCKHCNLFASEVFDLKAIGSVCVVCGEDMWGKVTGRRFCKNHEPPHQRMLAGAEEQEAYVDRRTDVLPDWAAYLPDGVDFATANYDARATAIDKANNIWLDEQIAQQGK